MPSHCFQPMPHGIHLVLGFDLALYSRSEDFHLLDCVHAAHTNKGRLSLPYKLIKETS